MSLTYADVRIVAEYTPNESIIEKELASTSTNNFIHGVTPAPILTTGTVIRESAPPAAISSIKTSPKRKWQGQQLVNVEEVDLNGGGAGEVVVVFQGRGTMAAVAGDIIGMLRPVFRWIMYNNRLRKENSMGEERIPLVVIGVK